MVISQFGTTIYGPRGDWSDVSQSFAVDFQYSEDGGSTWQTADRHQHAGSGRTLIGGKYLTAQSLQLVVSGFPAGAPPHYARTFYRLVPAPVVPPKIVATADPSAWTSTDTSFVYGQSGAAAKFQSVPGDTSLYTALANIVAITPGKKYGIQMDATCNELSQYDLAACYVYLTVASGDKCPCNSAPNPWPTDPGPWRTVTTSVGNQYVAAAGETTGQFKYQGFGPGVTGDWIMYQNVHLIEVLWT